MRIIAAVREMLIVEGYICILDANLDRLKQGYMRGSASLKRWGSNCPIDKKCFEGDAD